MILGLDVLSALGATITCNPRGVLFNVEPNPGQVIKPGEVQGQQHGPVESRQTRIWSLASVPMGVRIAGITTERDQGGRTE